MAEPMIIRIPDLRTALTRALDLAEARLGSTVKLDADYYWHLAVDDAFDIASEPTTLTVGQVSDDLEEIHDDHDRVPEEAWHDLSHLIGVLRALELAVRA